MTVVSVGSKGTVLGYATTMEKKRRHQRNSHDAAEKVHVHQAQVSCRPVQDNA